MITMTSSATNSGIKSAATQIAKQSNPCFYGCFLHETEPVPLVFLPPSILEDNRGGYAAVSFYDLLVRQATVSSDKSNSKH